MILDDLFEQKPLPAHIKPSDLPPAMRNRRLTMRDIEKERPQGAYRYQVGDKQFLDLRSAQEFATGTGQRVMPIKEQADDPDVQRGMTNLNAIEKQLNTNMKVVLQNETGQPAYQIELPVDKQWLISHAQEWIDAGKSSDLYKLMGTNKGFEFLLAAWQKEDVIRAKRQQDVRPEEPDLFGSGQSGKPKSTRYQDEGQHGQKKRTELDEAPAGASARTERMMAQMRARQPQATSDLEAMAYELQDAERRDAEEINKLEKDVDSLETDIKQDLQKRIASLTRRRGGIRQAAVQDTKTDAVLDQLAKVNDEQQREINNLERAVAGLADQSKGVRAPAAGVAAQTATKSAQPAPKPAPVAPSSLKVDAPAAATAAKPAITTVSPAKPDSKTSDAVSDVGTIDFRQKFGIPSQDIDYQQVAEAPLSGFKSTLGTVGRGILGKSGRTPFRDLTPAEKTSNLRAQVARSAQAMGAKGTAAQQKQGMANISGAEQSRITNQLKTLAAQIRQAEIAGDVNTSKALRSQFEILRYRAGLLKGEAGKAQKPTASTTGISPGAFGQMASQLSGRGTQPTTAAATPAAVTFKAAPVQPAAATPTPKVSGWRMGQPITVGKQTLTPKDPQYAQIAQQLSKQSVKKQDLGEKKDRSPGKISKSEDPCWSGYHMVGTKKKGGRTVPNCVLGAKGSANESLREMSEQAALAKLRTRDHPAFQMFAESWYRAHGGV